MPCETVEDRECGLVVVCSEDLAGGVPDRLRGLVGAMPVGNISNRVQGDRIIYVYRSPGGGGFLVEASLDGLASGRCGTPLREALVPLVESMLSGDPMLPFILMIVMEKMLR